MTTGRTTDPDARTGQALREAGWFIGLSMLLAGAAALVVGTLGPGFQFVLALGPGVIAIALAWHSRTLRRLLGSVVKRPADPRWYLVLLLPVMGSLAVVPVASFLGLPTAGLLGNLTATALIIPFVVLLPAVAEEIGWRGFILTRILPRFSPLTAGLLIAIPWSLMHLGLYLPGQPYDGLAVWPSIVTVTALSIIGTWIFVRTDGSVLMTSLFHAGFNASTPFTWSVDPDAAWAIRPVIFAIIAVAIVLFGGLRAASRTDEPVHRSAVPVGSRS